MVSHDHFLATGLKAVESRCSENATCTICVDSPEDPVAISCPGNHVFCKPCIQTWFKTAGGNVCPLCKAVLFDAWSPFTDNTSAADEWQEIRELAPTYENNSVLPAFTDNGTATRDPYDLAVTFLRHHQSHSYDVLRIIVVQRGQRHTIPIAGRGVLPPIEQLRLRVQAFANTRRAQAEITGHRFEPRLVEEWNNLAAHIDLVLRKYQGKKYSDVSDLRWQFTHALQRAWRKSHDEQARLSERSQYAWDTLVPDVMNFVSYLAWKEARLAERALARASEGECQIARCAIM